MTTITLPPDVEASLIEQARKQGKTPEGLAIDTLRKSLVPDIQLGGSLFDFLSEYIGTVNGSTEMLSEKTGEQFTDLLVEKQQRARL
jgi:hypothetical protein